MQKLKKEDISQEVFDLYDDYAHNKIGRSQFLKKLSLKIDFNKMTLYIKC